MSELAKIINGDIMTPRRFKKFFDEFDYPFMMDFFKEDFKGSFMPKLDVSEDKNNLFIKVELPGIDKKDVKLTLNDDILTISGEKKKEEKEEKENFFRIERNYGAFSRSITLPLEVKTDKIEAEYKDGVLNVILPKTEEKKKAEKFIEIK